MKKVLFLDIVHPILEKRLTEMGFVCEHDTTSSFEIIKEKLTSFFGLVIRSRIPINEELLNSAKDLRFIARSGSGLENIDVNYAEKKGVCVLNSPEGNRDAVGEHALGMILSLFNNLKRGDDEVRKGMWKREGNRGLELKGKVVGIIGYGFMGSAFAKKLSGLGCQVIAYDKYKKGFSNNFVQEVGLDTIFNETEILSIHLPLSKETHYYVNENFISRFQKPFYIVNTARGNHVCLSQLVEAIQKEKVLGACLDVLEYEARSFETFNPSPSSEEFNYLKNSDKVILSPHVAGWTQESYYKLSSILADKVEEKFFEE